MAPMITDSYLKYSNSDFGANKSLNQGFAAGAQANTQSLQSHVTASYYSKQQATMPQSDANSNSHSNLNNVNHSGNYSSQSLRQANNENSLNNFKLDSLQKSLLDSTRRRYTAEENIGEILRSNSTKLQIDLLDELIARVQANTEVTPIQIRNLEQFYDAIGMLLSNTMSNEVQKYCLRFLQVYFKSVEKLKFKKGNNEILKATADQIDVNLNNVLIPYLITLSVSNKLQLKQLSIDLIYTYMKLTDNMAALFAKFVKYGVENSDYSISKSFMDPILCIMLTEEFKTKDFSLLVKSLVKQLSNSIFENSASKCLVKIENIVKGDVFNSYLAKLPQNLREVYATYKQNKSSPSSSSSTSTATNNAGESNIPNNPTNSNSDKSTTRSVATNGQTGDNNEILMIAEQMTAKHQNQMLANGKNLKYNVIAPQIISALSGEDEVQRLQAIKQLEMTVKSIADIKVVYPYYQEFISYMNNFVDDSNYEVRLCSLKILCIFIQKLEGNVNQCYKVICTCARQVMTQTHQSKPIKQSLNTMLLLTIENMKNPILILDCLLDKIKDRSAKAREEFLNIIMGAILKYPSDKFEPLRKIFYQVTALLCDIKRNVRHAALECVAVIYYKLKQIDKNVNNLLDCLETVTEFQNFDNINGIKEVIWCRLNRNKLPTLNPDMSIEYAVKIPVMSSMYGISDLDIEWIVSATSSSGSASNLSSARSQKSSMFGEIGNSNSSTGASSMHRMASFVDNNQIPINFKQRRIPSANKRLPWEQSNSIEGENQAISNSGQNGFNAKVVRGRETAPLKAFPLNDDPLDLNGFSSSKSTYTQASSYQEKYLKKLGMSADSVSGGVSNNPRSSSYQSTSSKGLESNSQTIERNDEYMDTARRQSEKYFSLDNLYNIDDNINSENSIQKRKLANLNNKNGIIPSRPTIPRRNSASKHHSNGNNSSAEQSYLNSTLNGNTSQLLDDEDLEAEELNKSLANSSYGNSKKYDTMPNLRTSAKNRKKLEKLFAIGTGDAADHLIGSSNYKNGQAKIENNLYLSKLKADKNNDLNTSRYTPSNPESGIFSMSDYDQLENSNRVNSQQFNGKKNMAQAILNGQTNPNRALANQLLASNSPSNAEYNPLAGVSFKATHGSDVEIVGVKLGNGNGPIPQDNYLQQNQQNAASRKKASFQGLGDPTRPIGNEEDMLDIVGRGYNSNAYGQALYGIDRQIKQQYREHEAFSQEVYKQPEEIDYPMSLSFQSRLRQKTQEKIQEKMKKKDEVKKQKEVEGYTASAMNSSPSDRASSPPLPNKNFGLSISGYQNQSSSSVMGKPPIYNQAEIPNPYNEYSERVIQTKANKYDFDESKAYFNDTNLDSIENLLENRYYVPNNGNGPSQNERAKFKPTAATQNRLRAKALAAATSNSPVPPELDSPPVNQAKPSYNSLSSYKSTERETDPAPYSVSASGTRELDYVKQPFKNPESAYKEAMNLIALDDWEKKCTAMNIIRRLSAYHEDLTTSNIHTIVLALCAEVRNLRSQVSRFGLVTFGDLFTNLKKNMDVDLDISVKTILQKNAETNDFIKADVEKCLNKMTNNVTTHKGLIALLNGGAGHRNPSIRRTTAQFIYKMCEIMGPGKILSGIKDVTEKILVTASQFVVDGPVDIRWYGRKIFYMLMSHDEFERLLVKYLNEKTRKDIKEILDTIRVKGPGDVPTESARNSRKSIRQNNEQISRSAGNDNRPGSSFATGFESGASQRKIGHSAPRLSQQSQESMKAIAQALRNTDFRERIDAIEKFQVACETATELVIANIVPLFDKFNPSLADSNSKVNYKALNTMFQITPILADNLSPVIANVVPTVAQNLASKNSEIQDLASNILDVFIEYLDGSQLIQPFTNLAMHANTRIRPLLVIKLADLIAITYPRKQKQCELHVLPAVWSLLNAVKGNSGSALTNSVCRLVQSMYEQMGDLLIEKASASSNVPARNLDLLKELLSAPVR